MATPHVDCDADDWDNWEKNELGMVKESQLREQEAIR